MSEPTRSDPRDNTMTWWEIQVPDLEVGKAFEDLIGVGKSGGGGRLPAVGRGEPHQVVSLGGRHHDAGRG